MLGLRFSSCKGFVYRGSRGSKGTTKVGVSFFGESTRKAKKKIYGRLVYLWI